MCLPKRNGAVAVAVAALPAAAALLFPLSTPISLVVVAVVVGGTIVFVICGAQRKAIFSLIIFYFLH